MDSSGATAESAGEPLRLYAGCSSCKWRWKEQKKVRLPFERPYSCGPLSARPWKRRDCRQFGPRPRSERRGRRLETLRFRPGVGPRPAVGVRLRVDGRLGAP